MNFTKDWIMAQFPLIANHPQLSYLDSAASSQKPKVVLEAMKHYNEWTHANIHRGAYGLSIQATARYEQARERVASFIHAKQAEEIIFTKGTTESINLVAFSAGMSLLKQGDEVVISLAEHHSNIVPWQQLKQLVGIELKILEVDEEGRIITDQLKEVITEKTKFVAFTHVSNALGTKQPVEEIVRRAKEVGAYTLIDVAQSIPHQPIDVQALDVDFLAFSGHKIFGPTGIGVLYGKLDLLNQMMPYQTGGDMIEYVELQSSTFAPVPQKFEAGTQPIEAAIGLHAALDFVESVGYSSIQAHEKELLAYATQKLEALPFITIHGPKELSEKTGVISFSVTDVHPHDVASILDSYHVAIRAGHHCAQPLMKFLKVPATSRMSFSIYNTHEDIDSAIEALSQVRRWLGFGS